MTAIKITVLKKAFHADLAEKYSGIEVRPCEVFSDGQEFITGLNMPVGFCGWAWNDIQKWVLTLFNGGNFNKGAIFRDWMKDDKTALACCTDGFRPVTFKLERIETLDLMQTDGLENAAPREVYGSERWGEFVYSFPELNPGGKYTVRLHFTEIYFSGPEQRLFNMDANGKRILDDFDICEEAGGAFKPIIREISLRADSEGRIVLTSVPGRADQPKISAVEIVPEDGEDPVYAINAGGPGQGRFSEDKYFEGGNVFGG
jgi:uncharacterized repeat protein (TIGR04076 family)